MNCDELFAKGKEICSRADFRDYKKRFVIQAIVEGDGGGKFWFEVNEGKANVDKGEKEKWDMRVTVTNENLIAVTEGRLDAKKAFLSGKVKVEGMTKVLELKKIAGILKESYGKTPAMV